MSTHATAAFVGASQGGVTRAAQAQGKRVQQAELGKIASAGFAQILGEQVAKSTPQAETGEKVGRRFTPNDVFAPSPHAPTQALRQSLPHPSTQPTPMASQNSTSQARVQVRLEPGDYSAAGTESALPGETRQSASGDQRVTGIAQPVRTETSGQRAEAGSSNRVPSNRVPTLSRQGATPEVLPNQFGKAALAVGQETQTLTQTIAQPIAQPTAGNSRSSLLAARTDSSAANAQKPMPKTMAIPSTRVGEAVYKFTGQPETPVKPTMAPDSEKQSTRPAQGQGAHNDAHAMDNHPASGVTLQSAEAPQPTRATDGQSAHSIATPTAASEIPRPAHIAARRIEPASPQPVLKPELSPSLQAGAHVGQDLEHGSSVAETPVKMTQAPSPSPTSAPVREQIPAQSPTATRVPTRTNESVATVLSKAGETAAHVPIQTRHTTVHAQQAAGDNSPRFSSKVNQAAEPALPQMGQSAIQAAVLTSPTVAQPKSTTIENTTHSPSPSWPLVAPADAAKRSVAPTSADNAAGASALTAHSQHRPGSESMANLLQPHKAAQIPQAQELPRPILATAPRTIAPALEQQAPTQPVAEPPAHDPKVSAPVQSHARAGQNTVAEASPPQEQKTAKRPASTPAPLAEQAPSLPIAQPSPTTVAQESSATQVVHNTQPASPPETASPTPSAKAGTRAATARPATSHADVLEETKPTESTSEVKRPEPSANHVVTSSESTARAITDKTGPASPKHAEVLPAPEPGHVGNKSAVHVEPSTSKRRAQVEDEKEQEEASTAPTKPSQTSSLQPSHAPANDPIEVKTPKPDSQQPNDHKLATEASSQASSAPSPASQPHVAKDEMPAVLLPTAERLTMFVAPNTFLPGTSEAGVREAPAPHPVAAETAGLVDRANEDPGLSVTVMPHSAHLSIAGDAGDLSLHVRVRDGSADVNVSGTMAPLFDTKAPEVRTVLAGEGLQLGSFATDQRGGSQGQQGQPESTPRTSEQHPMTTLHRTSTASPEIQIAADRRIHVTA